MVVGRRRAAPSRRRRRGALLRCPRGGGPAGVDGAGEAAAGAGWAGRTRHKAVREEELDEAHDAALEDEELDNVLRICSNLFLFTFWSFWLQLCLSDGQWH